MTIHTIIFGAALIAQLSVGPVLSDDNITQRPSYVSDREIVISQADSAYHTAFCQARIKVNPDRIPDRCKPKEKTPEDILWANAKEDLESQNKPLSYENLKPLLTAPMITALETEADAFMKRCSYVQGTLSIKTEDCSCYRQVYLDERAKAVSFNMGTGFPDHGASRKASKECVASAVEPAVAVDTEKVSTATKTDPEKQENSEEAYPNGTVNNSNIDTSNMSAFCKKYLSHSKAIPIKCRPGYVPDPEEKAWQEAKKQLETEEKPLTYINLQPNLSETMITKLEAEADAFVVSCQKRELTAPMKARDCVCLRGKYLDERSNYQNFKIGNVGFLESLMSGRIWKSCVIESGVKEYVYDSCVRSYENKKRTNLNKDIAEHCDCISDFSQREYLDTMVDGQTLGIHQQIFVSAETSCR